MNKIILLLIFGVFALIMVVDANVGVSQKENIVDEKDREIVAEFYIYSGVNIPDWILSIDEAEELKAKLNNIPQSKTKELPQHSYILIKNENKVSNFYYYQIYVFCPTYTMPEHLLTSMKLNDSLIIVDNNGEKKYYEDTNNICEWLIQSGKEHDPNYISSQPIPPNTPQIGSVTLSLFRSNATVKQNTHLSMPFITIFSEGTATLEGTISTPDFITVDKDSFSKPPHSGGEDFKIEVDTSEQREIRGDIIIKTNDPSRSVIKIPVHYIIIENNMTPEESIETPTTDKLIKQKLPPKSPDHEPNYNNHLIIAIILITILLSAFVIYYKKFK